MDESKQSIRESQRQLILDSLTAFAALEEILNHTNITKLAQCGNPRLWHLCTDNDLMGGEESNWTDPTLVGVLRAAAADLAYDALDEMERSRELAHEADAPQEVDRG